MKLAVSFLTNGCQNPLKRMTAKFRAFSEKLLATEVAADALGEEWKSDVLRISGGNDKQGFPMKQGVLTYCRVCLHWARDILVLDQEELERGSASVFEDVLWMPIWVISACIVKKGEKGIPGLTETPLPWQLGLRRAHRKWKESPVCCQKTYKEGKKSRAKAPKIERLVTLHVLQRKRQHAALKKQHTKKNEEEAAKYAQLLTKRMKGAKEKCPRVLGDVGCPHWELLLLSRVKMSKK